MKNLEGVTGMASLNGFVFDLQLFGMPASLKGSKGDSVTVTAAETDKLNLYFLKDDGSIDTEVVDYVAGTPTTNFGTLLAYTDHSGNFIWAVNKDLTGAVTATLDNGVEDVPATDYVTFGIYSGDTTFTIVGATTSTTINWVSYVISFGDTDGDIDVPNKLIIKNGSFAVSGSLNVDLSAAGASHVVYTKETTISNAEVTLATGKVTLTKNGTSISDVCVVKDGTVGVLESGTAIYENLEANSTLTLNLKAYTLANGTTGATFIETSSDSVSYLTVGAVKIGDRIDIANTDVSKTSSLNTNDEDAFVTVSNGDTYSITGLHNGKTLNIDGITYTYSFTNGSVLLTDHNGRRYRGGTTEGEAFSVTINEGTADVITGLQMEGTLADALAGAGSRTKLYRQNDGANVYVITDAESYNGFTRIGTVNGNQITLTEKQENAVDLAGVTATIKVDDTSKGSLFSVGEAQFTLDEKDDSVTLVEATINNKVSAKVSDTGGSGLTLISSRKSLWTSIELGNGIFYSAFGETNDGVKMKIANGVVASITGLTNKEAVFAPTSASEGAGISVYYTTDEGLYPVVKRNSDEKFITGGPDVDLVAVTGWSSTSQNN